MRPVQGVVLAYAQASFRLVHVGVDAIPILYSFLYPWYGISACQEGKQLIPSSSPPLLQIGPLKAMLNEGLQNRKVKALFGPKDYIATYSTCYSM